MSITDTLRDRGNVYGDFADNAKTAQDLLDVARQSPNYLAMSKAQKEALHMMFHKIARLLNGDHTHLDSAHDMTGYSKLFEEATALLGGNDADRK